jgi:hypothetical protein
MTMMTVFFKSFHERSPGDPPTAPRVVCGEYKRKRPSSSSSSSSVSIWADFDLARDEWAVGCWILGITDTKMQVAVYAICSSCQEHEPARIEARLLEDVPKP